MKRFEKSGDRTGPSGAGAMDAIEGLTERRCLAIVRMSASSLRYRRDRIATASNCG